MTAQLLSLVSATSSNNDSASHSESNQQDTSPEPECPVGWEDEWVALPVLSAPEQLAEFLGVETATLTDWRYHKKGPRATKLGERLIRYRRTDVVAWLRTADDSPGSQA